MQLTTGTAGAGIALTAPLLTSTLSTVSHVGPTCENATATGITADIFDALTHVDASVAIGLDLTAQAELDAGDVNFKADAPYTLLGTSYALPTACLAFDPGAKSYGPARATAAAPTATKGRGAGDSGAGGVANPFRAGWAGALAVAGLMAVGSTCFVLV